MSAVPAAEVYGDALARPHTQLRARFSDGPTHTLPIDRWLGPATREERAALDRVAGPVLDVGCGAGRHVIELQRRGIAVLGVDLVRDAVEIARRRGGAVLQRSVFARLPGEGRWASALLFDGNVGIGGDPPALLARLAQLLRPGGRILVELAPSEAAGGAVRVRVEGRAGASEWFPWARLSVGEIEAVAGDAGFTLLACWEDAGRSFGMLRTP